LLTIWRTDWLRIAGVDLTFAPFLLLIGGLWVAPRLAAEERMLWLWFGVPLLASLFAIATPRTHVYIYYVPWALLAGLGATTCLAWLERRRGRRTAFAAGAAAAAVATALFGGWLYLAFVDADREMVLNWETAKPDFYWTPAASGTIDRLYGFPINNGWKAAGALHAQGVLGGDYDVLIGADFVPAWYMRSQERCLSTAEWYLTVRGLEPWVAEPKDSYDLVEAYGFVPWGQVLVNGRKVMRIFSRSAETPTEERLLDTQAYEATFDAAADPFMPLTYPLIRPQMATPMQANFGDTIVLEGFTLDYPSPLHPGDEIVLTLQWRGRRSMEESFKVTNQMYDANGNFAAQRDAMPLCDRRPTDIWYEGEGVIDRHSIRINEDALPGEYILYTALYDGETGARLPLLDDAGQPIDDKVQIAALTVVAP
jgi:hypothetical protein